MIKVKKRKILLLPGDGIGPEVVAEVKKIIEIIPKDLNGIKFSYRPNNEVTALYERKKHKIEEIINKVKNTGMEIYDISTDEGDLEDVFIHLTKG